MSRERWARVQEVFHDALARLPEQRDAFLAQACAADGELRREVDALLDSHAQAGAFLETSVAAPLQLQPGMRVGRYEIGPLLGTGGMGEVHRARDTRLQRDVAIKVLPAALAESPDRLARFEQEARAA